VRSSGVFDFYQGGELWDVTLVDPNNRRCLHKAPVRTCAIQAGAGLWSFNENWRLTPAQRGQKPGGAWPT